MKPKALPHDFNNRLDSRLAVSIPAMPRDDGDHGDFPITNLLNPRYPRHSSHPIPLIPFWRGFEH